MRNVVYKPVMNTKDDAKSKPQESWRSLASKKYSLCVFNHNTCCFICFGVFFCVCVCVSLESESDAMLHLMDSWCYFEREKRTLMRICVCIWSDCMWMFSISSFKYCGRFIHLHPNVFVYYLLFKPSGMTVLPKWSNQVFILTKCHIQCVYFNI